MRTRAILLLLCLGCLHSVSAHADAGSANPYGRDCRLPSLASTMCFVTSFLGSTLAVSIPTHITGYRMPTVVQTAIMWTTTGIGLAYGAGGGTGFFAVMGEALGERKSAMYLAEHRHRLWRLTITNWAMLILALAFVTGSVALFIAGLGMRHSQWIAFCDPAGTAAGTSSAASTSPSSTNTCEQQWISQQYLLLGGAVFLLTLEILRFRAFTIFLHSRQEASIESPEPFSVEAANEKARRGRQKSPMPRLGSLGSGGSFGGERQGQEQQPMDEFGRMVAGRRGREREVRRGRVKGGRRGKEMSGSEEEEALLVV